mgnify:FL=1
MEVKLEQVSGKNLATGKVQTLEKYMIICDSELVGYIHYRHSNEPAFIVRLDPLKKQQVIEEIASILNVSSLGSKEAPEIPEEFIGSEPGEEFYEFDEEDTA